jgi:hypothetical protein
MPFATALTKKRLKNCKIISVTSQPNSRKRKTIVVKLKKEEK